MVWPSTGSASVIIVQLEYLSQNPSLTQPTASVRCVELLILVRIELIHIKTQSASVFE